MKRLYIFLITALTMLPCVGQTIRVAVPQHVAVGEQFRLCYTVETQDVKNFRGGNVPDGLEVLMGPSTSSQSSFQMVNGHTSSSSSISYTYIISAERAGTYTIGAAHATVGGKAAVSAAVRIRVSGQASASAAAGQQQQPGAQVRQAGARITGNDLFIRVTANKRRVHEQEPILLTYKVYTQVELTQLEGKMPDLKGFHTQEVQLPQQKSFHVESVNGRPYRCVTWSQYVMFPQMTGRLTIPSITFKGIVVQENRNVDPFEAFFNGGSGYVEVKKNIVAEAVDVQVEPLPKRPAGFSGGVGQFAIKGSLDKQTVRANDPVTLRLTVSGIGNLKLLRQPVVEFPKDFDRYDPKTTDHTRLTANGVEGSVTYDYLFVPRHQGDFTLPAVKFIYYDTRANAYKTIETQPLTVHVTPGRGGSATVADFSADDQDIRPLKHGALDTTRESLFFGSTAYKAIIAAVLAAFLALVVVFRKRALANADIVGRRGRKANKVAVKRLRRAAKLMRQGKQSEFYDEVLRALWGYVGDKLNIPVAELSRENIAARLAERQVPEETIAVFVAAIDECEYARYAPGEALGKMSNVYDKAMNGITDIDAFLGKKQHPRNPKGGVVRTLLFLITLTLSATPLWGAGELSTADSAYAKGNYQAAVAIYKELVREKPSGELWYNLANALYRSDNITQAVVAYNRAALLLPADDDVAHSLAVARAKTIDKMQPRQPTFIAAAWEGLRDALGPDAWAALSIAALVAMVLLTLTFLFGSAVWLRQTGFIGAIAALAVVVVSIICGACQLSRLDSDRGAVVTRPVCPVVTAPEAKAATAATVHEGTHLTITDETVPHWLEVTLDDGTDGWIPATAVERVRQPF